MIARIQEVAMKKFLGPFVVGILIGAAALYLILGRPTLPGKAPAAKTSFDRVTAQLDKGGDLYFYYNVERIIPLVKDFAKTIREAIPVPPEMKKAPTGQALEFMNKLGLQEIDGFGASTIAVDKNLYRTRSVLHHPPDKGEGLLWSLLNQGDRDFDLLRRLPAEAVLANMIDIRVDKLWDWLKTALPQGPPGKPNFGQAMADLEAKGIPLEKMVLSLQGPLAYILTLDPQKKITIPAAGQAVEFPEPGMALSLTVKDATIFDFLKTKIPGAVYEEKEGVRRLKIAVPPAPIPLAPAILLKDNLLAAATTESLAEAMITGASGAKLMETESFRGLSRDLPLKGASFSYLGPGLAKTVLDVLEKIAPAQEDPARPKIAALIRKFIPEDLAVLAIAQNGKEGIVSVTNHTVPMEKLFLLQLAPLLTLPKTFSSALTKAPAPPVKL
jgi:hypothetical protein